MQTGFANLEMMSIKHGLQSEAQFGIHALA